MKTHSILLGAILMASAMPALAQSASGTQSMKMDQSAQSMQMRQNPSHMQMMMDCMHMHEGTQSGQGMHMGKGTQGMSTGKNMPCKDQTAQGVGVVKAIDTATGMITIQHQAIASIHWPAMTMTFKAAPPSLLNSVKVGEKVHFTLHPAGKDSTVTAIAAQP
jgi:Cu/Ag efflux protein CusF